MRYLLLPLLVLFAPLCWSEEDIAKNKCPNNYAAKVVSLQGTLYFDPDGKRHWQPAQLNETLCEGSRVQVEANSRASLLLTNGITLRLDAGTVLSLNGLVPDKPTLLELFKGFVHFISRTPKRLQINTPIANAGPEGTEFAMSVDDNNASLWVYEGGVKFFNEKGSVRLSPGQGAQAQKGQAPQAHIDIKPKDAVNWALYYPPILPYPEAATNIDSNIRTAIQDYRQGRSNAALSRLDRLPPGQQTPYFHKVRGAILLSVGQDKLALQDIHTLLTHNPNDAEALALQSVIALTQNRKDEAYTLANRAVSANPQSATAYSALSYAEQGRFQLDKAQSAATQATKLAPHDAMVWARKAELELAQGLTSQSQEAAQQALGLDANLERTQTVTGFTYLLHMDTDEALQSFNKAIELDSSSPLARLGLGLAKIRDGDLAEGRQDLEIAAILDPNNSLIRSYLGKAYYEERRNPLAEDQFKLAKERDPKDPTPYFYDALKKQTENRPVEALQDLQKAMALNDNRAVYRSKQLLDADRAARGASLARIYDNLGFEQRGIVEATSSLQLDPTNFSAHRFLSDTYVNQPSRETAQLSELLQAKMLQPININPVQPHLSVSQRGLLSASGIANSSFQDFTRVFEGNRPQLLISGVAGNQGILGEEAVLSGIIDKFSYSLGQFHHQTDGFTRPYGAEEERKNTVQRHDIYDAFLQWAITDRINTQFEFVHRETEQGDLHQYLIGNPQFLGRNNLADNTYRGGVNLRIFTDDHLLASYIHTDAVTRNFRIFSDKSNFTDDHRATDFFEGQYLHHRQVYNVIAGFNLYKLTHYQNFSFDLTQNSPGEDNGRNGHSEYAYVNLKLPRSITGTLGLSYHFTESFPFLETGDRGKTQSAGLYPKIGLLWDIDNKTKLRFAYIRGHKQPIAAIQTLEPTQIAGFNQFFDNLADSTFSFYGGALDLVINPNLFTGIELSRRELYGVNVSTLVSRNDSSKIYLNWTPSDQISMSAQYKYSHNDRPMNDLLSTHIVPLELRYFDPSGLFGKVTGTYISQSQKKQTQDNLKGAASFFLLDAAIGFRLPKRMGIVSLEGKNLLDNKFKFEDMNTFEGTNVFFNASEFIPQRTFFARITLNF
ncbi:MAG: TonB-dependent receptor [Methyloglobulus sp.]|nr:TonB-dependent receptor [Methyloglobulus sp.]